MKHKPSAYRAIALWGKRLGSFPNYIKNEQRLAAEQDAPLDAIYQRDDKSWVTVSEVQNNTVRAELEEALAQP